MRTFLKLVAAWLMPVVGLVVGLILWASVNWQLGVIAFAISVAISLALFVHLGIRGVKNARALGKELATPATPDMNIGTRNESDRL